MRLYIFVGLCAAIAASHVYAESTSSSALEEIRTLIGAFHSYESTLTAAIEDITSNIQVRNSRNSINEVITGLGNALASVIQHISTLPDAIKDAVNGQIVAIFAALQQLGSALLSTVPAEVATSDSFQAQLANAYDQAKKNVQLLESTIASV